MADMENHIGQPLSDDLREMIAAYYDVPVKMLADPDASGRMSFEDSMREIADRYSKAIELLGRL